MKLPQFPLAAATISLIVLMAGGRENTPQRAGDSLPAQVQAAPTSEPSHGTLVGVVRTVDKAGKEIVVESEGGVTTVVHVTEKTAVKMVAAGTPAAKETVDLTDASWDALKEGSHVVVVFTEDAGVKTAETIHDFGRDALHSVSGIVEDVREAGKTVTVKTADGAIHVLEVSEHVIVDKGSKAATEAGTAIEKGAAVTVHYTEAGGRKLAHLFKL